MTLFVRLCGARLRKKPGQFCRAPALRNHPRCRLHAGRPKGSSSPEGLAASRAGHAAHYAKRRAAKARGEAVRPSGGRPKKWLIPRCWRYRLSPEDEARVLASMMLHGRTTRIVRPPWQPIASQRLGARALESLERTFVMRLNDRDHSLATREVDAMYQNIRTYEAMVGSPGSDARLARIAWEITQYKRRHATDDVLATVREAQASTGCGESIPVQSPQLLATVPHEPLPDPFAGPDDPESVEGLVELVEASHHLGLSPPPPPDPRRPAGMSDTAWQRMLAQSEAVVVAGCATGRRFAGERIEPERRHSIAWLRR